MTARSADERVHEHDTPRLAIAGVAFAVAAVAALDETLGSSDRPTTAVIWGALALAGSVAAFATAMPRRRRLASREGSSGSS